MSFEIEKSLNLFELRFLEEKSLSKKQALK